MKINILGTDYEILCSTPISDKTLEFCAGYCDNTVKKCVINDLSSNESTPKDVGDTEEYIRRTKRHEIVHAFLSESGLDENSEWARNEELVDWIAIQGPKIWKAWQEAGAVE